MRRWKKILSASLVAVMVGSLGMTAFAEDTSANEPIDTTVSNYNLTEEETSGKNQEEIKALQQQKIDEVTQQAYDMKIASNELENWPEGPATYGEAGIVMEAKSGAILYAKNIDGKAYPASITKILTALVALENGNLDDKITITQNSVDCVAEGDAYIGMIGSRRRSAMVKQNLIEKGCSQEVIGEINSPIGLNIGAETPEEIGVAIMAEIIEVKNQNKRVCGYPEDLLEAILDIAHPGKKMLATIITRKGSAPRNVGSKMLILEDGSCVGTIGGGCMEAEVLRKARVMMHENNTGLKTEYVDMTGDDAEEEGMVCGGTIEVLLEPLWN